MSRREAAWFLEALVAHDDEASALQNRQRQQASVHSDSAERGRTCARKRLLREPGDYTTLRLETIVHQAAAWRLRDELGWPLSHLVIESPDVVDDCGEPLLRREGLDILLLEEACPELPSKMTITAARSRVGVEAKADKDDLARLLNAMRDCEEGLVDADEPRHRIDHKKCNALDVLQPRFFPGVAAGETWRLFPVVERDGRAVFGDELPGLADIRFVGC